MGPCKTFNLAGFPIAAAIILGCSSTDVAAVTMASPAQIAPLFCGVTLRPGDCRAMDVARAALLMAAIARPGLAESSVRSTIGALATRSDGSARVLACVPRMPASAPPTARGLRAN